MFGLDDSFDLGEEEPPARSLIDPAQWIQAQRDNAVALADAALTVGRLDQLIIGLTPDMRQGALLRLAVIETEAMLWGQGTPLRREEIGRDLMDARAATDLDAMKLARWAIRRLEGQTALTDLRAFLALHRTDHTATGAAPFASRPMGRDFDDAARDFLSAFDRFSALHPLARAGAVQVAWRMAELSNPEDLIESAVWVGRDMARRCEALSFVPLGRHGRRVWLGGGEAASRLPKYLDAIRQGASEACQQLSRLFTWAEQAKSATRTIKGDNSARVIAALMTRPLLTTAMVEEHAGISRDTAERLLRRMQSEGIVREVTGTRRFRLWTAAD
ncbi:hypothetical protein JJJ17_16020 [Paracoccus caeni]|uniref:HTH DNA binding domain-containing protein n=1 Tax=Paracoccus caeni TaxID=657651 RepID=A0A934SI00_9RHOB|nr:helix-turn-helix domain-containing protein [Paracoccus caeni]MBK4217436.1 hypothetical protein [Paracoccus caeni]